MWTNTEAKTFNVWYREMIWKTNSIFFQISNSRVFYNKTATMQRTKMFSTTVSPCTAVQTHTSLWVLLFAILYAFKNNEKKTTVIWVAKWLILNQSKCDYSFYRQMRHQLELRYYKFIPREIWRDKYWKKNPIFPRSVEVAT